MTNVAGADLSAAAMGHQRVCGIEELVEHQGAGMSHILSLVDPDLPELVQFDQFPPHQRTILRFHDIIEPLPGKIAPEQSHIDAILAFGARIGGDMSVARTLVHCHMGVSRSTAAMLMVMAQAEPDVSEADLYARLRQIRPQAWPNSRMIRFADQTLRRDGKLFAALRRHYAHQLVHHPRFASWMPELGRKAEVDLAVPS
jgi:predicted protein tyrosine phosphatase